MLYSQLGRAQQADEAFAAAKARAEELTGQTLGDARSIVVDGYAQIGDFEQANQLAASIESSSGQLRAYSDIAAAYAKAGAVEEANRVAQSIGMDEFTRLGMMRAYIETEQYEQAQQIAIQSDMTNYLPEVGQAYCAAGQSEQVVALIGLLESKRLESNPAPADWLRSCAAIAFAEQQQFDRATTLAHTIRSTEYRADALIAIAAQHNVPTSSF